MNSENNINNVQNLIEGIEYDKEQDTFIFNFKSDNVTEIIKLVSNGPYQITDYSPCTYFGYVFEDNIDVKTKKKFIDLIKYPNQYIQKSDFHRFINNSVAMLDKKVSLPKYKVLVHPQSSSKLNNEIINEIYKRSLSTKFYDIELIKDIPSRMEFNYDAYINFLKQKEGINQNNIDDSVKAIKRMMDGIRKLDYVKIGTYIKAKYRPYIKNFFMFKRDEDEKFYKAIKNENILIVDDVSTTMSTLQYVVNTLRLINDENELTLFCLLGNKK